MHHELRSLADATAVAAQAAQFVADVAREAVADHDQFTCAVSGGRTPWAMFASLSTLDVPWHRTRLFQVDERVAPVGDPQRNLTQLQRALAGVPVVIEAMPVEATDLPAAAREYAELLPAAFDLVHLGLGPDGHTASLVPGDPVLEVVDSPVGVTVNPYQGLRRMTLTFPALGRARQLVWLVTGADKTRPLRRLLSGDRSIPAGRVEAAASLVMADAAALRG